ncbi:PLP-dependent aminotransferase family protein [Rhodanobacter aciditrophus]|uniref:PLP-dependent aminotransferase family protein n=1 Tax=Rhodanobacter aciditrophus TaxID=1623218 RepID=A0ABW4AZG2_9GAMM
MIASLSFSLESNETPRYQQLQQQLLAAIEQGRLGVGDKLPSSRSLAQSLGVSRSVVIQTYEQLIAEGVLISEPKRGVFVAAVERVMPKSSTVARSQPVAPTFAFDSGVDVGAFPRKAWAASMRRSWLNPDPNLLTGGFRAGFPPLRLAIVDYLYALRGLECSPEQIILTAGNRDALALLTHALRSETRTWLLENPTYPPIQASVSSYDSLSLPVTDQGAHPPENLQQWGAILTPNRQYPLGISYSSPVREQWLEALASGQGYVIEDDYDNEFVYQGKPQAPLMQLAQRRGAASERVFYVGSFSKVLFRGLRMGFIVAPSSQVERIMGSQQALGLSASLPVQPVIADFMETGSFYRHLNRMRRLYRHKRDVLIDALDRHLGQWFDWERPSGGMHVILHVKPDYTSDVWWQALDQGCRAKGLHLSWLHSHYPSGEPAPLGLVLGFSGPDEANLTLWVCWIADVAQRIE